MKRWLIVAAVAYVVIVAVACIAAGADPLEGDTAGALRFLVPDRKALP